MISKPAELLSQAKWPILGACLAVAACVDTHHDGARQPLAIYVLADTGARLAVFEEESFLIDANGNFDNRRINLSCKPRENLLCAGALGPIAVDVERVNAALPYEVEFTSFGYEESEVSSFVRYEPRCLVWAEDRSRCNFAIVDWQLGGDVSVLGQFTYNPDVGVLSMITASPSAPTRRQMIYQFHSGAAMLSPEWLFRIKDNGEGN